MATREECAQWTRNWAESVGGTRRDASAGWETVLLDGSCVLATAKEEWFAACAGPTRSSLPSRQLLERQFESAVVFSLLEAEEDCVRKRAALPLNGLTENHLTALMSAVAGLPVAARRDLEACNRDLAVLAQCWEDNSGATHMARRQNGSLTARFRLRPDAPQIEVQAEPTSLGVRLEAELVSGPFMERECAPSLCRYLLGLNARLFLGGFALRQDEAVVYSVLLPTPVSGHHARVGTAALTASCFRFWNTIQALATDRAAAEWWSRFNLQNFNLQNRKGGETE